MGDNNEQAKHEVGKLFSSFLPNHMMHIYARGSGKKERLDLLPRIDVCSLNSSPIVIRNLLQFLYCWYASCLLPYCTAYGCRRYTY